MKDDASHIESIRVVSNTRWDREFRKSFEKTRRRLVTMLDVTLGALESDSAYHSFTMDGHCIMIDDYLELRGEKRALIEKLAEDGSGYIVRMFNPCDAEQAVTLSWGTPVKSAVSCGMDGSGREPVTVEGGRVLVSMTARKILTLRVQL
jgi:alpha-mannosidase